LKIVEIAFRIKHCMLFFSKKCHDCTKNKIPHIVTSQINIEWIKASHVDMDLFYKKKKLIFLEAFLVYL
jgi:hypothetical protein